jgi:hypothetical protein
VTEPTEKGAEFAKLMEGMNGVFAEATAKQAAIKAFLMMLGFGEMYAREAAEMMADDWLNGAQLPLWLYPSYQGIAECDLQFWPQDVQDHIRGNKWR